MNMDVITPKQIENRKLWVEKISRLSADFGFDVEKLEEQIEKETRDKGIETLIGHLRLSGAIPERYGHDTSEEKLYAKYTDIVIHKAYLAIGLDSRVIAERAGFADVECIAENYGFVADAKAFRLSRTAKNQKDFKVEAMNDWKHGRQYAMIVCPVYQLPARTSQIYQQATSRSVCIATYTHLAVFVRYAQLNTKGTAVELLHEVFKTVEAMNPSKDASAYWQALNRSVLDFDPDIRDIWREEKQAAAEAVRISREEALDFLASERDRIMRFSKEQAIREVLKSSKIEKKIEVIGSVSDNGLLELGWDES